MGEIFIIYVAPSFTLVRAESVPTEIVDAEREKRNNSITNNYPKLRDYIPSHFFLDKKDL